jgi:hypothetical protein
MQRHVFCHRHLIFFSLSIMIISICPVLSFIKFKFIKPFVVKEKPPQQVAYVVPYYPQHHPTYQYSQSVYQHPQSYYHPSQNQPHYPQSQNWQNQGFSVATAEPTIPPVSVEMIPPPSPLEEANDIPQDVQVGNGGGITIKFHNLSLSRMLRLMPRMTINLSFGL